MKVVEGGRVPRRSEAKTGPDRRGRMPALKRGGWGHPPSRRMGGRLWRSSRREQKAARRSLLWEQRCVNFPQICAKM